MKRNIYPLILFILMGCSSTHQSDKQDESDVHFEKQLEKDSLILSRIKNKDSITSIKLKQASDYYEYFINHPQSATGRRAVTKAFNFWDYEGQYNTLRTAFRKIDIDNSIWPLLAERFRMSYIMEDRLDEFIIQIEEYNKIASLPESRNFIFRELGDDRYRKYKHLGDTVYRDSARYFFTKLIDLNVVEPEVSRSKKILYELDSLAVGKPFPNIIAKDIFNRDVNLDAHHGKVIIVDFWATWCGPCIPEIPYFKELYEKYSRDQLEIIGISLDRDTDKLKEFLVDNDIRWTQVCDGKKWEGPLVDKYNGFRSIPKTYVVNQQGVIKFKDLRKDALTDAISTLIEE
jgi:thiol-disulfide isomerase/thioredoxin